MLNRPYPARPAPHWQAPGHSRQRGVVLMVALIVLVALTLGSLAIVRSIDTTGLISGNLAFRQSALRSAELGTETAMRTFIAAMTTAAPTLWADDFARAYSASTPNPDIGSTAADWDAAWFAQINPNDNTVVPGACSNGTATGGRVCVLATDPATRNTVSYTIHRLCRAAGDPLLTSTSGCARGSQTPTEGVDFGAGSPPPPDLPQTFYRITTRVAGPRNTSTYVQTIVAR